LDKQWLLFLLSSPLSSPLICFANDEIVQVHTLYEIQANDQELVRNLAPLLLLLCFADDEIV
jgi:hypothetical protein